ncbi:enoyl-CoA hydratase [Actinomadura sp. LD22]|uniref:enoyl-CoA hydratase n=1 Tax=Actinomadura physcomitrii TaxID=2650748 RepID=A0A6I4M529_9ACTN|nr:enoyl-CoA hydratase-related protein [Actinomadura physcomitrii]MWA00893.1 enoyl-CoA hydratase [Actinomadura physcomitrii]
MHQLKGFGPAVGADGELLVSDHEHVRVLTINRPHALNAITTVLGDRLGDALSAADADPHVRAIVITGSGERAFCAGGDLKEIDASSTRSGRGVRVVTRLVQQRIATPVIAAVNGLAYGGGLELMLGCDLVVSASHARFALPEVKRGLLASGGGLVRLQDVVGQRRALQMLLTGEPIDAPTAHEWGLVNTLAPQGEVLATALRLASIIAENAPLSVRMSKAAVYETARLPEAEAWALTASYHARLIKSDDAVEGPRAFAEKRPPRWSER